ncbi:MAG: YfhO family protein, partial [Oscillospiraceae bacterium]|nr:YfhO family protein [Oscillospiraceae bacterium]
SDMSTQYIHFFSALRNGDVFFSNNLALSGSFAGTFAYYLSSPLSVLVFLFRKEQIQSAMLLIIYLKLSLSAVSFGYLQYSLTGTADTSMLIFPFCYSLMSFGFFFFINAFWLDSFIYLPLLVLSVLKLIESGRSGILPVILAVLFISNFYISYIVGIFLLLFLVTESIAQSLTVKQIMNRILKLTEYALVAIGMAAVVLLPAFLDLSKSFRADSFDGYGQLNFTLKQLLLKLLPGSYDSIGNLAAPTVFCGVLVFILAVGYFLLSNIKPKDKICHAALLVVMMLSFLLPALDRVWHVFAYPNAFAYRYAFCFSFLLIFLSVKTLRNLDYLPSTYLMSWFILPLLCLFFMRRLLSNSSMGSVITFISAVTLCLVILLLLKHIESVRLKQFLAVGMVILNILELTLNGTMIIRAMETADDDTAYIFPNYSEWVEEYETVSYLLEMTQTNEASFLRVESLLPDSYNRGGSLRYMGVSLFSSCYSEKLQRLYGQLGYYGEYKGYWYKTGSPQLDALFGIGWLVAPTNNLNGYHEVAEENGIYLLASDAKNLPGIMFPVSDEIYSVMLTDRANDNVSEILSCCHIDFFGQPNDFIVVVRDWQKKRISVECSAPVDFVMQTTLQYDKNYSVYIDGKKTDFTETLGALFAFDVTSGSHSIIIEYHNKGVYIGMTISLLSLLGYLLVIWIRKSRQG